MVYVLFDDCNLLFVILIIAYWELECNGRY